MSELSTISCFASEIETLIKLLNPNKATGLDAVSNRRLKAVTKDDSFPLRCFNMSFRESKFAQIFKDTLVIP